MNGEQPIDVKMKKLLKERGSVHGDYKEMCTIIQGIKNVMKFNQKRWDSLEAYQKETVEMFAVKIGRILAGDQNYDDHWIDIAGYATKCEENLPKDP